jgi:hypothetical protein
MRQLNTPGRESRDVTARGRVRERETAAEGGGKARGNPWSVIPGYWIPDLDSGPGSGIPKFRVASRPFPDRSSGWHGPALRAALPRVPFRSSRPRIPARRPSRSDRHCRCCRSAACFPGAPRSAPGGVSQAISPLDTGSWLIGVIEYARGSSDRRDCRGRHRS